VAQARSSSWFLLALALAVIFIWSSSRSLPALVGSHYAASGLATNYMPRAMYLRFTLLFAVLLPLALAYFPVFAMSRDGARVNLPNREYWLAPRQRAATLEFVRRHCTRLALLLLLFFCYIHWLVTRANLVQPPLLSSSWFIAGIVVLLVCALMWTVTFVGHFQRLPD